MEVQDQGRGGRRLTDGAHAVQGIREGLKRIGGLRAWAMACALRLRYRRYPRHRTPVPYQRWRSKVEGQWKGGGLSRSQSRVKVTGHGSRARRRPSAVRRKDRVQE